MYKNYAKLLKQLKFYLIMSKFKVLSVQLPKIASNFANLFQKIPLF